MAILLDMSVISGLIGGKLSVCPKNAPDKVVYIHKKWGNRQKNGNKVDRVPQNRYNNK